MLFAVPDADDGEHLKSGEPEALALNDIEYLLPLATSQLIELPSEHLPEIVPDATN